MSKNNYFGKAFTFQFAVYSNELGEYEDLSGVTDNPAIYVYSSKPSRSDAASGDGSPIETISAWSDDPKVNGKVFTIAAIDDPEPTAERRVHEYWVAINYRRVNSGTPVLALRMLPIERPIDVASPVDVTPADLKQVFAEIGSYSEESEQQAKIKLAISLVASELAKDGYEWASLYEPDDLNLCVTFKTISLILFSSRFSENGQIMELAKMFKSDSDTLLKSLVTRFDVNKDGSPDNIDPNDSEQVVNDSLFFIR